MAYLEYALLLKMMLIFFVRLIKWKKLILETFQLILEVYKKFDFKDFKIAISTRPDKAMGSDELWNKATIALENALKELEFRTKLRKAMAHFMGRK